jgi:hypothetical protein
MYRSRPAASTTLMGGTYIGNEAGRIAKDHRGAAHCPW